MDNQVDDREEDDNEFPEVKGLREFVYLDSMSVNSLLASHYMSVPQKVIEAVEDHEENQAQKGVEASLNLPNLLQLGGNTESSYSEKEVGRRRITNRINDQYRFTVLLKTLEEEGKIHDLTDENGKDRDQTQTNSHENKEVQNEDYKEWDIFKEEKLVDAKIVTSSEKDEENIKLSPGDVVKIKGKCRTDPLFRAFGLVSLLEPDDSGMRFKLPNEMQMDEQRKRLYNGMVGLKIETEKGKGPFGMVVKEEKLWIDGRREFLRPREYTILGRVEGDIPSDAKWDLVDYFRVLGEFLPWTGETLCRLFARLPWQPDSAHDGASLALRPITETRSNTPIQHAPLPPHS